MRYSREHKEQTAGRIRDAIRRGFRGEGYAGLSVDAIAQAAGVTSGAFYSHFRSKSDAFREIVQEGMACLSVAVDGARAKDPQLWLKDFSRWYLSSPRKGAADDGSLPIQGACALPTLSPELPRCDDDTRTAYEVELLKILDAVVAGLPGPKREARRVAWAYLSMLTGAIILARAVPSERTAKEITQAALQAIFQLTDAAPRNGQP